MLLFIHTAPHPHKKEPEEESGCLIIEANCTQHPRQEAEEGSSYYNSSQAGSWGRQHAPIEATERKLALPHNTAHQDTYFYVITDVKMCSEYTALYPSNKNTIHQIGNID